MSSASRANPSLHLYGKLPIAKDYLRVGCGDGPARELREWLDEGFSSAPPGGLAPELAFPMRFLAGDAWSARSPGTGVLSKWLGRIGGDGAALIGCAWPSSDAGGLRPFPLSVFVERKSSEIARELELGLDATDAWWTALESEHDWIAAQPETESLLASARRRRVAPAERSAPANAAGFDEWSAALWPDDTHARLREMLAALASCVRERPDDPLRFPLVGDAPTLAQVHAWWRAWSLVHESPHARVPTLFFPCSSGSGDIGAFVVLYPSKPRPADVAWLVRPSERAPLGTGDFGRLRPIRRREAAASECAQSPPIEAGLRAALSEFGHLAR